MLTPDDICTVFHGERSKWRLRHRIEVATLDGPHRFDVVTKTVWFDGGAARCVIEAALGAPCDPALAERYLNEHVSHWGDVWNITRADVLSWLDTRGGLPHDFRTPTHLA